MSTDPLKRTFWGYSISALRGCCALKFLHALQIDQALLAHIGTGMGPPPKKKSLKFKIWPKIYRVRLNNFRTTGSILTKLFSVDVPRCRSDKLSTIFGRPAPKNLGGPKNRPKFCSISDNFRLCGVGRPHVGLCPALLVFVRGPKFITSPGKVW